MQVQLQKFSEALCSSTGKQKTSRVFKIREVGTVFQEINFET